MQTEDYAAVDALAADDPDRAFALGSAWMRHMRRGDFSRAWDVSDEVLKTRAGQSCDQLPRHYQWVWNGEPLHGKRVLVRCYHGLGDTIQFIRYAALLRRIASRVMVWAQPELIPLLKTVDGVDELIALHPGSVAADFDADVEVMELPHVFRSTLENLPANVPYLHVDPSPRRADDQLHVGLVWKCGDWNPERSIPVALLQPLAEIPGVTLHIIQRGSGLAERPPGFGVTSGSDDLSAAAQRIAALDLMISIDSMPAHLAGALGVPTWTLLQSPADWRWMDARDDTPWYPTMRLFRQERGGDWEMVTRQVEDALRQLVSSR